MPGFTRPEEEHRVAFEEFERTRSKRAVSKTIGCEYRTVMAWAAEDYKCTYMCPWHGWDKLLEERNKALDAKLACIETGNFDPVAHDKAVTEAVQHSETRACTTASRRQAVETLVRSDIERIAHLEFLYNQVFFQATGLTLDHPSLVSHFGDHVVPTAIKPGDLNEQQLREAIYSKSTLRCTNLSSAINTLVQLTDQIDKLRESLGVKKKPLISPAEEHEEHEVHEVLPGVETQKLSLEDLRKFRDMVQATPSEHLELLRRAMRADDDEVASILGADGDAPQSIPIKVG